ncbi:hypothetical protein Q7A53_05835 [Halobacillus rhizosphaerae]|uniref:hypothetical protein n=1 Tax=Halobacillus rhizosphaerae TaxID=3064889 RepID=UPI00398ADB2C
MNTFKIYKNGNEIDEILMRTDSEIKAITYWLDNSKLADDYEMVEKDESGYYVEINGVFYHIINIG